MRLIRHPDAGAFLRDAQGALERDEALHGLVLGLALALRDGRYPVEAAPYLATARDGAGVALAALMTPPHHLNLAAGRGDASAALEALVGELRAAGVRPPGVHGVAELAGAFAERWSRAAGVEPRLAHRQRLYALTEVEAVPEPPGRFRAAGEEDVERVGRWMAAFDAEALGEEDVERARAAARRRIAAGEVFLWDDGEPRAMAASTRPTARGISVNAVYTPPEGRGRGCATACVARLSRRLLAEGRSFCTLFTDLANPTANAIYTRIGYRPVADFAMYRFGG